MKGIFLKYKNKKAQGSELLLWIARIFILVFLAGFLAFMISSQRGVKYDIRPIEASAIAYQILNCISSEGHLILEPEEITSDYIKNNCGLKIDEKEIYVYLWYFELKEILAIQTEEETPEIILDSEYIPYSYNPKENKWCNYSDIQKAEINSNCLSFEEIIKRIEFKTGRSGMVRAISTPTILKKDSPKVIIGDELIRAYCKIKKEKKAYLNYEFDKIKGAPFCKRVGVYLLDKEDSSKIYVVNLEIAIDKKNKNE